MWFFTSNTPRATGEDIGTLRGDNYRPGRVFSEEVLQQHLSFRQVIQRFQAFVQHHQARPVHQSAGDLQLHPLTVRQRSASGGELRV